MWLEEFQGGSHLGYWNRMISAILNFQNTPMPPFSLSSIRLTVREQMWFEDFKDGCHGGHLEYQNGTILAKPPTKFWPNLTYHSEAEKVWRFSGGHLRKYLTRTILAILNLYVALMPPIKFGLNPDYGLGGDVIWRISRWSSWWPAWMLERNKFSSSESPCLPNASHQVSA